MRITPLEIRQKTFEKNFRGYEKDEVHGFLLTLSQEWEKLQDENKELRIKLESTEREILKLREVEGSLYKTLKTAEDTGASVVEQAKKAAELHLKESQLKAEAMLQEAKQKAKDTIEESENRAREVVGEMEERLKALVENYKKLESAREDLLADLKRLGSDLLERVERSKSTTRDFDPDKHFAQVRREAKKIIFPNFEESRLTKELKEQKEEAKAPETRPLFKAPLEANGETFTAEAPRKVQKSFFDDIG